MSAPVQLLIHERNIPQHQTTGYHGDCSVCTTIITGPVILPEKIIRVSIRGAGDERLWQPGVTTAFHSTCSAFMLFWVCFTISHWPLPVIRTYKWRLLLDQSILRSSTGSKMGAAPFLLLLLCVTGEITYQNDFSLEDL